MFGWWRANFKTSKEFGAAVDSQKNFQPERAASAQYELAYDYAWRRYEAELRGTEGVDAKASQLVQTASTIATVISLLGAFSKSMPLWAIAIPVVTLLVAVLLAIWVQSLQEWPVPPTASDLVELASRYHLTTYRARVAMLVSTATVGLIPVREWKASRLAWANFTLVLGVVLIFVPLSFEVLTPAAATSASSAGSTTAADPPTSASIPASSPPPSSSPSTGDPP